MKPKVWKCFFKISLVFSALGPFLPVSYINAQTGERPVIEWEKTFGGSNIDAIAFSVQQTTDGGYIMVGALLSSSTGDYDVYLIKIDEKGDEQWEKTFDSSIHDIAYSVQQTTDGGYIMVGQTAYLDGSFSNVYLIKTDEKGDEQWEKTFSRTGQDVAFSVQQTTDGGYIIGGGTNYYSGGSSDVYLIKTYENGDEQWEKTFGGSGIDYRGYNSAQSVQQTTDGGYILVGKTTSFGVGSYDVYLIKTDKFGNKLWDKTFGGEGLDMGYSVQQTADGGYIIGGCINTDTYYDDAYLIKTDENGDEQWEKTFGREYDDCIYSVQQTTDGGYIMAGETNSSLFGAAKDLDAYLIKTDENGNEQWEKVFAGSGNGEDTINSVQQTTDGGYIGAGWTRLDDNKLNIWLIKIKVEPVEKGDINEDEKIDISDVILCLRQAVGLNEKDFSSADMNFDGKIDIADVILVLRKAIGLE
ncbi:MAG TPA: dockerin type I repeat-containing protein [bacterium]|nr:dockerin type I repeat-containing protein [bacterium]